MKITDLDLSRRKRLNEAFDLRKRQVGEVKLSKSSLTDPHIVKTIKYISKEKGIPEQEIIDEIQAKVDMFLPVQKKAPLLYGAIGDNIVESELFYFMQHHDVEVPSAPRFSKVVFFALVRAVAADQDEFWPLRSMIDKRPLRNPEWIFVSEHDKSDEQRIAETAHDVMNGKKPRTYKPRPEGHKPNTKHYLPTAAATPNAMFIFNTSFCQNLIDYAYLKGIHPKGRKYESNGGDIPDAWCYIEFLIMHEFLHYSRDDFYYQGILPNAKMATINWVGDFRSNYDLVKSGYEQLPIGLFNDHINLDRQKTYHEMYQLVESELEKLSKWSPSVGDIVKSPSGKFYKVKGVNIDGTIEADELPPKEVQKLRDEGWEFPT